MQLLSKLTWNEINDLKLYVKQFKGDYKEIISVPGKIKFGCEIEFNSLYDVKYYDKKIKNKDYNVKTDGSGVDIIEITSPILENTKKDWESMKKTLKAIKNGMISPNVGAHIHFDSSILSNENIINYLKLWYSLEDIIYEFATGEFAHLRRSTEIYAAKLSDSLKSHIDSFENGQVDLQSFSKYGKNYGLNLMNHLNYKALFGIFIDTYEIRVPNGTLDINIWQNNVEFFANMFKFANDYRNEDIINGIYSNGKLEVDTLNKLMVADLLFDNMDSKIRFLNQFELNKEYTGFPKKKKLFFR